jgi:DNA-binding protein H-NS
MMAKAHLKLQSMNVEALLKLRTAIATVLSYKRQELETQLRRLGLDGHARRSPRTSLKGLKVAPKYRGPNGETWAGRGAMPRWPAPPPGSRPAATRLRTRSGRSAFFL